MLVYDQPAGSPDIYKAVGITLLSLVDLQSLGLVSLEPLGVVRTGLPPTFTASYFGRSIEVTLSAASEMQFGVGEVVLTSSGRQLASICGAEPVDGLFEFVRDRWDRDDSVEALKVL